MINGETDEMVYAIYQNSNGSHLYFVSFNFSYSSVCWGDARFSKSIHSIHIFQIRGRAGCSEAGTHWNRCTDFLNFFRGLEENRIYMKFIDI